MYNFVQLDPRTIPASVEANEAIFASGPVLGIEVTIPALAARCGMGNFDHHGPEDDADTPSASEQALTAELPPNGATLATVRCDADSVTAMAIFASRLGSRTVDPAIVAAVGRFDRLGPSAGRPADAVLAITRRAGDHKIPLAERVAWVQAVLSSTADQAEIARLVAERDKEFEAARAASELRMEAGGRVAVVESTHRFATNLGYEEATIVVAFNPTMAVDFQDASKGTYRKFTVCRYDGHTPVDLPAALAELQSLEPGWGGRGDIFGSPQGVSSTLSVDKVVEVVARHLK